MCEDPDDYGKKGTAALKSGCTDFPLLGEIWAWIPGSFCLFVLLLLFFSLQTKSGDDRFAATRRKHGRREEDK